MSALATTMSKMKDPRTVTSSVKNLKVGRKTIVQYRICEQGEIVPQHAFARCIDGKYHRYLNADHATITTPPSFCPRCNLSYSETQGMVVKPCSECQWDAVAEWIGEVEKECGITLMAPPPDHESARQLADKMGNLRRHCGNKTSPYMQNRTHKRSSG